LLGIVFSYYLFSASADFINPYFLVSMEIINILVHRQILQLVDRVPGRCSSGSGVAIAGGMVDFAFSELIFVCFLFKQDVSLLTLLITAGYFIIP
jgi:hypothetical protein